MSAASYLISLNPRVRVPPTPAKPPRDLTHSQIISPLQISAEEGNERNTSPHNRSPPGRGTRSGGWVKTEDVSSAIQCWAMECYSDGCTRPFVVDRTSAFVVTGYPHARAAKQPRDQLFPPQQTIDHGLDSIRKHSTTLASNPASSRCRNLFAGRSCPSCRLHRPGQQGNVS